MNKFDEAAKTWDEKPRRMLIAKSAAEKIASFLDGKRLGKGLEFGCGTANLSFELKNLFDEIYAVDNSEGMISVLREKLEDSAVKNIIPLCADIFNGELSETGFDAVYSSMALHHVDDIKGLILLFSKKLNAGGILIWIDLLAEDGTFHGEDEKVFHHGFSKEDVGLEMEAAGISLEMFETFFDIRKENSKGIEKDFPLFIAIGRKN